MFKEHWVAACELWPRSSSIITLAASWPHQEEALSRPWQLSILSEQALLDIHADVGSKAAMFHSISCSPSACGLLPAVDGGLANDSFGFALYCFPPARPGAGLVCGAALEQAPHAVWRCQCWGQGVPVHVRHSIAPAVCKQYMQRTKQVCLLMQVPGGCARSCPAHHNVLAVHKQYMQDTDPVCVLMQQTNPVLLLTQVPGGWAAQRWGGRRTLMASFALWATACLLTPGTADNVAATAAARVAVGVAQGLLIPSIHTVLSQARAQEQCAKVKSDL